MNKRKKNLITLAIMVGVLLFSFPLLHMLYVKVRLNTVSLPLSSQVVSMGSNGIAPSGTNISFMLNKHYANTLEAKKDILKQLDAAGISILDPAAKPTYVFMQSDGARNTGLPITEIKMSFSPDYHELTFYLDQPFSCKQGDENYKALCENEVHNSDAIENKLMDSRSIRSVKVYGSVKFTPHK